jgi:hypothetical protein
MDCDNDYNNDYNIDNDNDNDTICEAFLFEIDRAVDSGDPNIIVVAIKNYQNHIDPCYIKMAQTMYFNLIEEKMDSMQI